MWSVLITARSSALIPLSSSYDFIHSARYIGGIGASLVVASIFPLGNHWSKLENGKLVVGILNGLGLTGGSAVELYV